MKRLLLLLLPVMGLAQTKEIKPGRYHSNSAGQDFILKMNEDKTYELVFLHGLYQQQGDTIKLNPEKSQQGAFSVIPVARDKASRYITIKMTNKMSRYFVYNIYIGTQQTESRPAEYKSIKDYMKSVDFDSEEPILFTIERTKFLYFANYGGTDFRPAKKKATSISKFEIPDDVSEIDLDYSYGGIDNLDFSLYRDENNEIVMAAGKSPSPLIFTEESEIVQRETLTAKVIEDPDFARNAGLITDTDEQMALEEEVVQSYNFKYAVEKTFDEAQKATARSKDKFLVVAFDYDNTKRVAEFEKFVARMETLVSNKMEGEYNAAEDHFNFYPASEKDKNLLVKNKFDLKKPQILVFNAGGDLIYHSTAKLNTSGYFGTYNSAYDELARANEYLKFDRVLSNRKSTQAATVKAFKSVSKVASPGNRADYAVPVPTATEVETETYTETYTETVVDTTVVSYSYDEEDYDYTPDVIRDKENLYQLQADPNTTNSKWAQIVSYFKQKNLYDQDFIDVGLAEVYGKGFTRKLFGKGKEAPEETDFQFLNYVFVHFEEIRKAEAEFHDEIHYQRNDVNFVLDRFFKSIADSAMDNETSRQKLLQYYRKFVVATGDNVNGLKLYFDFLQAILDEGTSQEYLDVYGRYYNAVVQPNASIIESLDRVYTNENEATRQLDWTNYKQSFAGTANTVAWYVVEHRLHESAVKNAIHWSETSLHIEPGNAYYLDTLAQLYYLNGEKERAISKEREAVKAALLMDDADTKSKYEEVLERMKNGTY
ncbi:hypothetical protein [Flavobacterium sp. BFFFF1]|uniref:hypothetical protein n=1 Tax=Flavobacterium sp. BFFFF1 TaxID=2015557 RepID=UPI0025C4FD62|nr:hypothetical protein [Flavobacterium sp. BFFFF1]